MLIDTGYKETAEDVASYLKASNVSKIGELIITHYDKDHIGGTKKLLSDFPAEKMYVPDYDKDGKKFKEFVKAVDKNDIDVECVADKISFTADNVSYSIAPSGVAYDPENENDNDMSLIVSAVNAKDSYLFTGDILEAGIKNYVNHNERTYFLFMLPPFQKTVILIVSEDATIISIIH